jgi:hypothetical protein
MAIAEDVRQCFQIVLNENKTFKYYINDYVAGKGVCLVARGKAIMIHYF